MVTATWNGVVIAESDDTVVVERNHYFPLDSVTPGTLEETETTTVCHWKGTASYFTVVADGERNVDAAFHYPAPSTAAREIDGRVAFWKGVEVTDHSR